MADKSTFAPEEWKRILGATMLAGIAVTAADRSGLWGMMKESMASSGALLDSRNDPNLNILIKAIVADFRTSEGRTAAREDIKAVLSDATSTADIHSKAIGALAQVASLLDAKAPEDAPAVKAWLQDIGERTASAANEGGFLGFGGVAVSDAEKAALDQIAKALNPPVG
jgi:hypothetical protein